MLHENIIINFVTIEWNKCFCFLLIVGKLTVRMANFSPNQKLSLSCPFDTSIRLMKATHGYRVESCNYKKAFQFVEER